MNQEEVLIPIGLCAIRQLKKQMKIWFFDQIPLLLQLNSTI